MLGSTNCCPRHLKPGGWIEFQELYCIPLCDDGTMPPDDPFLRFCNLINDALTAKGMSMNTSRALKHPLAIAGFTNIHVIKKKIPIGGWDRDETLRYVGRLEKVVILNVITAVTGRIFEDLGMTWLEREVWAAAVKRSIKDESVHRYFTMYFWIAQKPGS